MPSDTISRLKDSVPSFLKDFGSEVVKKAPEKWNNGEEFVTRTVVCLCGGKQFDVYAVAEKIARGIIWKSIVTEYSPPVQISCCLCKKPQLLFDHRIHGWNGQNPEGDKGTMGELSPMSEYQGVKIVVNYSYQNAENYEDLLADGVNNPQDYFDTITIYGIHGEGRTKKIMGCECS